MISYSPKQLEINAPVVTILERKNDNIKSIIAQCIVEMLAAQLFNKQKNNQISCIYGIITIGSNWKFLRLTKKQVDIEVGEYFIGNLEVLLGILIYMIKEAVGFNN